MINNIIFSSENNALEMHHVFTVDSYVTMLVKVKSGDFTGSTNFCISKESLTVTIETLSKLLNDLSGTCIINDYDSDSFLFFKIDQHGHVLSEGQIGGSHQDNFMRFKTCMDQTVLYNLIQLLKQFEEPDANL